MIDPSGPGDESNIIELWKPIITCTVQQLAWFALISWSIAK